MQRFSIIVLLSLVALASANNDLIVGERKADELIDQQLIEKDASLKATKEYITVKSKEGDHVITYIEIIDLRREHTSAMPYIVAGGIGKTYASIRFDSVTKGGIHFLVQVYGRPQHNSMNNSDINSGIDFNEKLLHNRY